MRELLMRRGLAVIIVALAGVVVFKSAIAPMLVQANLTRTQSSPYGLHIAQPVELKSVPAELIPLP
jgi:hypothetical protein